MRVILVATLIVTLPCFTAPLAGAGPQPSGPHGAVSSRQRPVTVADTIGMAAIDPELFEGSKEVANWSPDGEKFIVMEKKGNLSDNSNEYKILLFDTERLSDGPQALLSLSSKSNEPAIIQVDWVDNFTLIFIGAIGTAAQQIFEFDLRKSHLIQLTKSPTNIISYALSSNHKRLFYIANREGAAWRTPETLRHGIVVQRQPLTSLLMDKPPGPPVLPSDLVAKDLSSGRTKVLKTLGKVEFAFLHPSPDGHYVVLTTRPRRTPPFWMNYRDDRLRTEIRSRVGEDILLTHFSYEIVDADTGQSRLLVEAPVDLAGYWYSEASWASDSASLVVNGTYLSLKVANRQDYALRRTTRFVANVQVPDLIVTPIAAGDFEIVSRNRSHIVLRARVSANTSASSGGSLVGFEEVGRGVWRKEQPDTAKARVPHKIDVRIEQGMNEPPRIYAEDPGRRARSLLLDPNPQFSGLAMGHVEEIAFRGWDGTMERAGLYFPVDYVPGKKYPLVIQTHGWDKTKFSIDGPDSTAFAAQTLVGRGFFVVQLGESLVLGDNENREAMASYEGVIDFLSRDRSMVDPERVGLVGFSATGMHVKYALTHSKYHFAAANIADGADGGYYAYVTVGNIGFAVSGPAYEPLNGIPFGNDMTAWLKNAPAFNLTKVEGAVRLEADKPVNLLGNWEWFVGLSRLNKPVENILILDGSHPLVKPWDRLVSLEGNVEWFDFWLNGHEDPDPAKREQYLRWEKLCDLQRSEHPKRPAHCLPSKAQ